MSNFTYTLHGPMWQFECESCHYLGDCWDTEKEAIDEMHDHNCIKSWKQRIPADILEQLLKEYALEQLLKEYHD
jgi:NAD-dependent SIR2 family protein deacetylase